MKNQRKIDLVLLIKKIWSDRILVIKIVALFFVVGLFIAIFSPRVYTAKSVFIPQSGDTNKSSSSLGGLASLAGINLGEFSRSTDVPPALYPQFLASTEFMMKLLLVPVTIPGTSQQVTYQEYYEKYYKTGIFGIVKKYTLGLPGELIKTIQKKPEFVVQSHSEVPLFEQLTFEEFEHFNRLKGQLNVESKEDEGIVELTFKMPNPLMAAEMAQAAESLLQEQVINYKIHNANVQLEFMKERFEERKKEFEQTQKKLANFRDNNQNIISASLINYEQKLLAEYDFSFSIYTELAKQLEQAKIQVAKDTPVFSVIQKVTIPIQKSSPNRPLILIGFVVFGVVAALATCLIKQMLFYLKIDWNDLGHQSE
ncbi:Wzz/FepE/Etk N-terminal domain-containing protein [uncultured Algoriphagus sp.]|uniref:Wzz/FepE/Etk N-terminal domain-containing protein n=1 Tax=uncultured Algoriphagus sp. TaxID=417365 RepID=UPI0030EE5B19|tara:strand:- start:29750 stop:30853 length:1104 start_codon:yes stop_codon:yes gene_type:complete